jgi:CDGSH-type Zn-finger protein
MSTSELDAEDLTADDLVAEELIAGGMSPGSVTSARLRGIFTLDTLRDHLQWAVELEHATLPPYLTALYSLDRQTNPDAGPAVFSVFIEEMLHLALAANLLNAVGGAPVLDSPRLLPGYPRTLPHGDPSTELSLLPFGPRALEMFLRLEKPAPANASPEDDRYETIGQFYRAIEEGLRGLCAHLGEDAVFSGDPARQLTAVQFRHGGGRLFAVTNLATALAALDEILEQGEGTSRGSVWDGFSDPFHPERDEVAHYFRFEELRRGRRFRRGDTPASGPSGDPVVVDWTAIRRMRPNPRLDDHAPGHPVRAAQEEFNHTYCAMLETLERTFNGYPGEFGKAKGLMYALEAQAKTLLAWSYPDGTRAGPTFEYVPRESRHRQPGDPRRVVVLPNGPYLVLGEIPLRRKTKVVSENNDALTWQTGPDLPTGDTYVLCRCGGSASKPFCDGTHDRIGFDGTESADRHTYAERQHVHDGVGISAQRVGELCIHSAFCIGRTKPIAGMLADSADSDVRSAIMGRIEHCPSGSYTYALRRGGESIEPDLPEAISVLTEEAGIASALWITGGVPVVRSDGEPLEARNRVTLCRCGHSSNKPLCDGTHRMIGFQE